MTIVPKSRIREAVQHHLDLSGDIDAAISAVASMHHLSIEQVCECIEMQLAAGIDLMTSSTPAQMDSAYRQADRVVRRPHGKGLIT